jgi:hypothetical protein
MSMLFIEPGSSWENWCIQWFNGKLRVELVGREVFLHATGVTGSGGTLEKGV